MNLPEESIWEEEVYQLETTDVVLGGAVEEGGISNLQGLQLANRTKYLYDRLSNVGAYNSIGITEDVTLDPEVVRNSVIVLSPLANGKIASFDMESLPIGTIVNVMINQQSMYYGRCVGIKPVGGVILTKTGFNNPLWLHTGETIQLIKADSNMRILSHDSWIYDVGDIELKWKPPVHSLRSEGQLLNRADYPRLWNWVQATISGGGAGSFVTDLDWLAFPSNKGKFSTGNGSTTFRVPDLRGMFLRANDNSASIDPARIVGSVQQDMFKQHNHATGDYNVKIGLPATTPAGAVAFGVPATSAPTGNVNVTPGGIVSHETGGAETRPKNISYTAYIKY